MKLVVLIALIFALSQAVEGCGAPLGKPDCSWFPGGGAVWGCTWRSAEINHDSTLAEDVSDSPPGVVLVRNITPIIAEQTTEASFNNWFHI